MKKVLQNIPSAVWHAKGPTIRIVEGSNQWQQAYANYLRGLPPTESPHWREGVYCISEDGEPAQSQYEHFSHHPALAAKVPKETKEPGSLGFYGKIIAFTLAITLGPAAIFLIASIPENILFPIFTHSAAIIIGLVIGTLVYKSK